MNKYITITFLLFLSLSANSQHFIQLNNGKKIVSSEIVLKTPAFGKAYILLDGKDRYELDAISAFQNGDGYFKKLENRFGSEAFFRCEIDGPRIQVYSRRDHYVSWQPAAGGGMMPVSGSARTDLYVIGRMPPEELKYVNLKYDLADNDMAMAELKKVRNLKIVTGVLYAAGAGLIIAGISDTFSDREESGISGPSLSPLFIAGAVTLAVPLAVRPAKRSKMLKAIEIYNR